jgi:hypothetical protein
MCRVWKLVFQRNVVRDLVLCVLTPVVLLLLCGGYMFCRQSPWRCRERVGNGGVGSHWPDVHGSHGLDCDVFRLSTRAGALCKTGANEL